MKQIDLTKGMVSAVDDEDFETLVAFRWRAARKNAGVYYAVRNMCRQDGIRKTESMHRAVLSRKLGRPIADGMQCDHVNGDGLDNRRENLREATGSQNHHNRHWRRAEASSRFLGVTWDKGYEKWEARIRVLGKTIHLGRHVTEIAAAQAREVYIAAHSELNARSNFPKGGPDAT